MEQSFRISDRVALLATVTNFVTRKRLEIPLDYNFGLTEIIKIPRKWVPDWPSSGFQVAMAVYERGAPNITTWTDLPLPKSTST
jgi:hypothetical protein